MTVVLTLCALLVMGWFAFGSIWNVRLGTAAMRWMQDGLPLLGERTTVRWLGTTSVEMVIKKAEPPFEQVTLVVFLEPRDVPWIWVFSRRRGRRDTLIIRGALRATPQADLEVIDRVSWSGRDALGRMAAEAWLVREPVAEEGLPIYYKTPEALPTGDALVDVARSAGVTIRRLSVRRTQPNFQMHLTLPARTGAAGDFFRTVRALAGRAGT